MNKLIYVLFTLVLFAGCTPNTMSKDYGGKIEVKLPKNKKLMNVTWKESNLWMLCREMKENEKAENYNFIEKSDLGLLNGEVIIKEDR